MPNCHFSVHQYERFFKLSSREPGCFLDIPSMSSRSLHAPLITYAVLSHYLFAVVVDVVAECARERALCELRYADES